MTAPPVSRRPVLHADRTRPPDPIAPVGRSGLTSPGPIRSASGKKARPTRSVRPVRYSSVSRARQARGRVRDQMDKRSDRLARPSAFRCVSREVWALSISPIRLPLVVHQPAGSMTWTGWPSASEAALALTTASPAARPETTSVRVPSFRPSTIGRRAALPSATTTQHGLVRSPRRSPSPGRSARRGAPRRRWSRRRRGRAGAVPPGLGMSISTRIVRVFGSSAQEIRVTFPSTIRPFIAWSFDRGAVARVDLGGEGLGDVDRDGHDVGPGDDEQRGSRRRRAGSGRRCRRSAG